MIGKLFPFGYAVPDSAQTLETLMSDAKTLLIDTRYKPYCSWSNEWKQEFLRDKYKQRYRFAGTVLGNMNYKGGFIQIANPDVGIHGLLMYLQEGYNLVVMCGCKRYKDDEGNPICHRAEICDRVLEQLPDVEIVQHPVHEDSNMFMQKEWIPQEGMIPAISSQQPFPSAIAQGKKTIELKTWATRYRGMIAIHAGKQWYGGVKLPGRVTEEKIQPIKNALKRMSMSGKIADYPMGAIIAVARLVACRHLTSDEYKALQNEHRSDAAWEPNEYAWFFEDVRQLDTPIETRGYLGLFPVSATILNSVVTQ